MCGKAVPPRMLFQAAPAPWHCNCMKHTELRPCGCTPNSSLRCIDARAGCLLHACWHTGHHSTVVMHSRRTLHTPTRSSLLPRCSPSQQLTSQPAAQLASTCTGVLPCVRAAHSRHARLSQGHSCCTPHQICSRFTRRTMPGHRRHKHMWCLCCWLLVGHTTTAKDSVFTLCVTTMARNCTCLPHLNPQHSPPTPHHSSHQMPAATVFPGHHTTSCNVT